MARGKIPLTIITLAGDVVISASVTVNHRPGAAATIYQDETGGTTLSNPTTTDSNGRVPGWLEAGTYSAVISGGSPAVLGYTEHFDILQADSEVIDDRINNLVVATSPNLTKTYDDVANTLTLTALPGFATAKGDLWVSTGVGTATRLPVGTDGQALIADSTQATGLRWGTITPPFPDYTFNSLVLDRIMNASATTLGEFVNVLGTAVGDYPTFPSYTLTGVTPQRTLDATTGTLNDGAHVLCTVIADLAFGSVADYTVTGYSTLRVLDVPTATLGQGLNLLCTWISDLITAGELT